MISVPAEKVLKSARQSLVLILGIFVLAFSVATLLVNLWLKRYVVRPLNRMAQAAEAASMGDPGAEFVVNSLKGDKGTQRHTAQDFETIEGTKK